MSKSGYALFVPAGPRPLQKVRRPRMTRAQRRVTELGQVRAYRNMVIAGKIIFTGAFVFVSATFVAMAYAWRRV